MTTSRSIHTEGDFRVHRLFLLIRRHFLRDATSPAIGSCRYLPHRPGTQREWPRRRLAHRGVFSFCLPNWGGGAWATATSTHSVVAIAPFSGVGNVNLEPRVNGTLLASFAVFVGELSSFWVRGPRVSVEDPGCCFICACGTHLEVVRATLVRAAILDAEMRPCVPSSIKQPPHTA